MKKPLSLILILSLFLFLCPAFAAETVEPVAPSWVAQEDYLVFPGDAVYEPVNWAVVTTLRSEAEKGALLPPQGRDWAEGSPAECYERGLVRLKYAENAGVDTTEGREAFRSAGRAFEAAESGWLAAARGWDELGARLRLLRFGCYLVYGENYLQDKAWGRALVPALDTLHMTLDDFYAMPYMELVPEENRAVVTASVNEYWPFHQQEKLRVSVYLDGAVLDMDTEPQVVDQRTMVPIRAIAEALGADVGWSEEARDKVTLTRAGTDIVLTLGSKTAIVNGERVEMDVAPYAESNRTYVPIRFVSEFFGQKVEWVQTLSRVEITEDKSVAGESNLEAWAMAMSTLNVDTARSADVVEEARLILRGYHGVEDREALLAAVATALKNDRNADFQAAAKEVRNLTDTQIRRSGDLPQADTAWWIFTRDLWKKWGDRGVLTYDLFRAALLCRVGYQAGYLTYREVLELMGSAAQTVCDSFSSWEEVYENFADSINWLYREADTVDTWATERGLFTRIAYLEDAAYGPLLDDALFETGVIGLPEERRTHA